MATPLLSFDDNSTHTITHSRFRPFPRLSLASTCILMHVVLVLAHITLVVVHERRYEQRVVVSLGKDSDILSTAIRTTSQIIGTLYAAILVVITQQLALRRDFHLRQTLSALHDKQSAWLGIGSSLRVLWQQRKVNTAVWSIVTVAVYLSGIFVLHITTPGLFEVNPFNQTTNVLVESGYARTLPLDATFDEVTFGILPVIDDLPQMPTPGLYKNTIYDVDAFPLPDDASGNIIVNSSTYRVDCGLIQNVSLDDTNFNSTSGSWCPDSEVLPISGCIDIAGSLLRVLETSPDHTRPTLYIVSYMPIYDSRMVVEGAIPIDPQIQYPFRGLRNLTLDTVQVPNMTRSIPKWTAASKQSCVSLSSDTQVVPSSICGATGFLDIWIYDRFLTNDYLLPDNSRTSDEDGTWMFLDELNEAVAEAVASLYWYYYETNSYAGTGLGSTSFSVQQLRAQLNIVQVSLGLATSCVLLVTAWLLIRHEGTEQELNAGLDTAGLLQLTWLIGREPGIAERVAQVEEPHSDELRKAGLFDIHVANSVKLRRKGSSPEASAYGYGYITHSTSLDTLA